MPRTLEARVVELPATRRRTTKSKNASGNGNGNGTGRSRKGTSPRARAGSRKEATPKGPAQATQANQESQASRASEVDTSRAGRQVNPEREIEDVLARYSPLVKYVVDKISATLPKTVDVDDLNSSAVIGLYDAWEKFDSSRGTKFETYAVWRIRGAVLDELRALDWASRTTRRKARRVEEVSRDLDQKLGRAASDVEIANALGLDSQEFFRLSDEVQNAIHLSLERPQSHDESSDVMGLGEAIEADEDIDCLESVELDEARGILLGAINHLPEQERLVVALYYYEELTLKEIGEILGISESRVSQVHTKAIRRLRRRVPELAA
jgi:RNA polymerase sigma factor for flagellar operon FliA